MAEKPYDAPSHLIFFCYSICSVYNFVVLFVLLFYAFMCVCIFVSVCLSVCFYYIVITVGLFSKMGGQLR